MKSKRKIMAQLFACLLMVAVLFASSNSGTVEQISATQKIRLSSTTLKLKTGKSKQIKLKRGKEAIKGVKWKSTDKKVASVSNTGKVTAKKAGKTTIKAIYKKKTYKCEVVVNQVKSSGTSTQNNTTTPETENGTDEKMMTERKVEVLRINKKNADGTENTIFGRLYTPEAKEKSPAIILCHGFNGINTDFVNECNYYADNGYIAYAFDFCGGSGAGRCQSTGASTDTTITTEKEDLLAVFDYISKMDIVDENHVYVMGGSQGGLVASLATEERADKVAGLLLYFPAWNIPGDWKNMYPNLDTVPETFDFWGLMLGKGFVVDLRNYVDIFNIIGKYSKDVLIIHGDNDAIAPISNSKKAIEVYPSAELLMLPGEIHGFTGAGRKTAMDAVLSYLNKHTGRE